MNILIRLLDLHTPDLVKHRVLDALFDATATGFGCDTPRTEGRPYPERLAAYARFTRAQADRAIDEGCDLDELRARLRRVAFLWGRRLRRILGVNGTAAAMATARPLYRTLGIDFHGTADGDITIRGCFFCDVYTARVCHLISAIDEGVLAGLAGDGRLVFSQRITEGAGMCRARFIPMEVSP
jgi:hypothetical protein